MKRIPVTNLPKWTIKNFKKSLVIKHFTFIQKANKTSADLHKTYNVLVKAVKMGDPLGVFFLGRTVSKLDPKYAEYCYFNCYNEIVRFALKGNPHCQYVLSLYYAFNIKPIKYNKSEYFYWTNCAAANGIVSAVNNLGSLYFDGIGCKQNYSQAFRFFEDAAERGSDVALYNVARCYYHGLGVEKSYRKAAFFLMLAARNGHTKAMLMLGKDCYFMNRGVKLNFHKGFAWIQKASKDGDMVALSTLAECYKFGKGTKTDITKAISLWEKAASKGDLSAHYYLGDAYDEV